MLVKRAVIPAVDWRSLLFGDQVTDLLQDVAQEVASLAQTPLAAVAVNAGPTIALRAQVGLPDALALSGGLSAARWPISFPEPATRTAHTAILLQGSHDPLIAMLGACQILAVPLRVGGVLAGSLVAIDNRTRASVASSCLRLLRLSRSATRKLHLLGERLCAPVQRDTLVDEESVRRAIHGCAREALRAYERLETSTSLARWHVQTRVPPCPTFCHAVDEALVAAAELARHLQDAVRLSRRLDSHSPPCANLLRALAQALLVPPAIQPLLRVIQASRSLLRSPSLWTSALSVLPSAEEVNDFCGKSLDDLLLTTERLVNVRSSDATEDQEVTDRCRPASGS